MTLFIFSIAPWTAANTSTIGYARSTDGVHIDERHPTPAYIPRADFESKRGNSDGNSGCEDPRVVVIGDRVYMTYTAYDGAHNPRGALTSITIEDFLAKRFDSWDMPILITPDEVDDKDVSLLPEKIGENFILYHRINNQICADVVPDLSFKKRVSRCIEIMGPRSGMWDEAKVGIAGPPIKVDEGWLMIYHGVSGHSHYRLGAALLDHTGLSVIARTADEIFQPIEEYEKNGEVRNVVFSCGHVVRGDTLYLYYGGGDKVLGVATASFARILRALS
jgi:beta-1,2-mannobiose phosphorylase / 1,2-beta-oligomannan phosphorylase